jgi:HAD superfamily hydrolase (TIGR01509 family)
VIEAVVFDLDGVLVDSEHVWDEVREALARERGGRWHERAQADMMGMSSVEWSRYMHDVIGLPESPADINREVVERMLARYRDDLPLIEGAVDAVRRLAPEFRLAVASSSNRPLIDAVLSAAGIDSLFEVTVSSEEVARGKPAPDVYLEGARRLELAPQHCAAIEDSANGIRSAHAAGLRVVAVPNTRYPPAADALALADVTLRPDRRSRVLKGRALPGGHHPPPLSASVTPKLRPVGYDFVPIDAPRRERTTSTPSAAPTARRSAQSTRPSTTHALWPPRPIAFDTAYSISECRASFGT